MSVQEYQATENELQTVVDNRQRLEAQLNENEQVRKEFASLKSHNVVYKLVGPVLVKQEHSEAKANVDTRMDFIKGELKRSEAKIKELEAKSEKQRDEIVALQAKQEE